MSVTARDGSRTALCTKYSLVENRAGAEGTSALAEGVRENRSLRTLRYVPERELGSDCLRTISCCADSRRVMLVLVAPRR